MVSEADAGAGRAANALIEAFGRDGYVLLTQFLKCDAAGRAELVARALELAGENPIKAALDDVR